MTLSRCWGSEVGGGRANKLAHSINFYQIIISLPKESKVQDHDPQTLHVRHAREFHTDRLVSISRLRFDVRVVVYGDRRRGSVLAPTWIVVRAASLSSRHRRPGRSRRRRRPRETATTTTATMASAAAAAAAGAIPSHRLRRPGEVRRTRDGGQLRRDGGARPLPRPRSPPPPRGGRRGAHEDARAAAGALRSAVGNLRASGVHRRDRRSG